VSINSRSDLTPRHGVPQTVDGKGQQIWDHGHEQDKFGELLTSPGAFQVSASIKDGDGRYGETDEVCFNQGGGEHGPWVFQRPRRDDGQGRDSLDANEAAHAKRGIEQRQKQQKKQKGAGQRWQIDAKWHGDEEGALERV
jgi:hypothetical protein